MGLGGFMRRWRRLVWLSVVVVGLHGQSAPLLADFRWSADGTTELSGECGSSSGDIGRHIEACDKALLLEARPLRRAQLLTWRGWQKRRHGDRHGGLRDFEAALKMAPAGYAALRGRAVLLSDLGRYDEAERAFTALLSEEETRALLYVDRGLVRRRAGRRDEALADFSAALQLDPEYGDALVQRGRLALEREDHGAALADLGAATRIDPKDPAALYWYAQALSAKGEQKEALLSFNRLVAMEPQDPVNWRERGRVQERRGDNAAALRSYDRGLKLAPRDDGLLFRRAYVLSVLGRADEAIKAYDVLLAAHPRHAPGRGNRAWHLVQKGEHKAAMGDAERAIALEPRRGQPHYVRGLVLFARKDYGAARRAFDRAVALGQTNTTDLYNTRGRAALRLRRYGEAAADFDMVIKRAPGAIFGYFNRGLADKHRGRWQDALGHFGKVLEIEPDDADAVRERNEMLVKLGREREIWGIRLAEAAKAIKRAVQSAQAPARASPTSRERLGTLDERLELDPYDDASRLQRARLLAATVEGRARASADVEHLLLSDSGNADARLLQARIHYDEKRFTQSLVDAEQVLAQAPKHPDAFFWRARARAALSQDEDAVADYTVAIALAPKFEVARFNRGLLHRKAGRFAEAEADFGAAIQLSPTEYDSWRYRGLVRLQQKRFAEAKADLAEALRLKPDHVGVTIDLGNALYRSGDHDGAAAHLGRAIERGVTSAVIWSNRCYFNVLRREFAEARSDCAEALRLEPQRAAAFHSLGAMKMHEGDVDAALAFFDRAIAGDPKSAFARFGRAIALLRKGELQLAQDAFEQARALERDIDERYREVGLSF